MSNKEQFKAFARLHPELVNHIKNGSMTWQKFYELYDIYGEDPAAWSSYLTPTTPQVDPTDLISSKLKSIDVNSIQEHIKTAQKALSLVSELTGKNTIPTSNTIPKVPRPINKFFED